MHLSDFIYHISKSSYFRRIFEFLIEKIDKKTYLCYNNLDIIYVRGRCFVLNNDKKAAVFNKMLELYQGDPKRIQHFTKVNYFAEYIAESENVDDKTFFIISSAALVHDIGIHESERKYNSSSGKYQEIEGPPLAEKLLSECKFDEKSIGRICFLVGHHHTYNNITDVDYQILVEADFIVNIYEDNLDIKQIESIKSKIFKTKSGINLLEKMFLTERK